MFDRGPITDAANEAVIAEILVEDSRGVFRGQVGQDDIYEGARVYRFRVVPGRFLDNSQYGNISYLAVRRCRKPEFKIK